LDLLNIKFFNKNNFNKSNLIPFCIDLTDTIFLRKSLFDSDCKNIIWLNPYKSELAFQSTIVVPTNCNLEKKGTFINLEGRPQQASTFVNKPVNSINNLINSIFTEKKNLFYEFKFLNFIHENVINSNLFNFSTPLFFLKFNYNYCKTIFFYYNYSFKTNDVEDFYRTNNSSKNSSIMAECSRQIRINTNNFN